MLGPYTVSENGVDRTAAVANDALADDNLSTFIDVDRYLTPPNVFLSQVEGQLGPVGTTPISDPRAVAYARFRASGSIDSVVLQVFGTGDSSRMVVGGTPLESTMGTLYPMDSQGITLVNRAIDGYNCRMSVTVPSSAGHDIIRISEAWIVVALPTYGAPPCRNLKRGDRLDLGGARNYPPSKMQQTSSRGVGAY